MIQTTKDPQKIVDIYAFLLQREAFADAAALELGLEVDNTYMGYSYADWRADLKTRAAQLGLEQKKRELEVLDKRVNSLVSPEQRREMELAALTAELGD